MSTRVEGRIVLKIHHATDAAAAARDLRYSLDDSGLEIEIVGLDLVQVQEQEADEA